MKFRVMLKDPDVLHDAIDDAVKASLADLLLSPKERAAVAETRREELHDIAGQWFEYGEYLTVEIDTEAKTCRVVPVGEEAANV